MGAGLAEMSKTEFPDDPLYTRREAAKYVNITRDTMARWASKGIGPAYITRGSKSYYRKSDLDAFLKEGEYHATGALK